MERVAPRFVRLRTKPNEAERNTSRLRSARASLALPPAPPSLIRRLQRGARLGLRRLGYSVTAFVDITLGTEVDEDLARFEAAVGQIDGIVECALVSGGYDYRLKVLCRDLDDYERLHREKMGRLPGVVKISSSFVLRSVPTRSEADALFAGAG